MKNYQYILIALTATLTTGCFNDLDQEPLNKQVTTSNSVFRNPESYKEFLAKLYGSLTLTGQRGEYGLPEISASDEGTTSFLRTYWSIQQISTDETVTAWGDPGLMEFNAHSWSSQNGYIQLLYQRVFINIAYCNEYIREVTPRVSGLSESLRTDVNRYVAEARFLRALYYYFALDLWGNVPFVTEADATGAFLPRQIKRPELFGYIERELQEILPELATPGANEYARADQAAAWMLLAKLYLNSEVYLGKDQKRYTECITYCNNIIHSHAFSLHGNYKELFLADNHRLRNEIILPIAEDGDNTRSYGGMTFVIHAATGGGGSLINDFGIEAGWFGNRFTSTFVQKFDDVSGNTDHRALFLTAGQTQEIDNMTVFTEGFLSSKYRNVTSTGAKGKNATFVDTDFPLFRYADVYLMYAEAVLREGAGGNTATALQYINELRTRAYGNNSGNISVSDLDLAFILDERARELHWEAHRRTDLIRYKLFTGADYLWDWKGGVKAGVATQARFNLMALPASDVAINTNLTQNDDF